MKLPHFTQHGTSVHGDALDLLNEESALLRELFAKWNTTTPDRTVGGEAVPAKWDHGTIGKLILEHAAVRLAAVEAIADVLSQIGKNDEGAAFRKENDAVRPILDQMYDSGRGVQPISVAITPGFIDAVEQLEELWRAELGAGREQRSLDALIAALGSDRSELRSAKYLRKHAPAHPGAQRRWYDRVPVLLRLHAAEDRLRGFPWGESSLGDQKLARHYDREI
ncbi:MAG TPA: hypothetical protein VHV57_11965 [Acidimicrobiales bacterium]|nr:hypothetical protein [Acidimicrobiales bacterium]